MLSHREAMLAVASLKHSRAKIDQKQVPQKRKIVNLLLTDWLTNDIVEQAKLLSCCTWQKTNYSEGTLTALARDVFLRFN